MPAIAIVAVSVTVTRPGIIAKAETYDRLRSSVDDAGGLLNVNDLRRALHVHDLRLTLLNDRSRLVHGSRLIDGRRLAVDDRRRRCVNRLRRNCGAQESASDAADDGTLTPSIMIMTPDEGASNRAQNRSADRGRLINLCVSRIGAGQQQ